jgi:hypothetical protein
MSTLIEKYAMLGNCKTAALVSDDGSIDWLCFPRFDAPACFAALLGDPENGRWKIFPRDKVISTSRRYRPGTMILETTFETETGVATVIDFMPKSNNRSSVARIVTGIEGEVAFDLELVIRFDYGSTVPWVETFGPFELGAYTLTAVAGPDLLVMNMPVEPQALDHKTVATFTVKQGDRLPFTLSHQTSSDAVDPAFNPEAARSATEY